MAAAGETAPVGGDGEAAEPSRGLPGDGAGEAGAAGVPSEVGAAGEAKVAGEVPGEASWEAWEREVSNELPGKATWEAGMAGANELLGEATWEAGPAEASNELPGKATWEAGMAGANELLGEATWEAGPAESSNELPGVDPTADIGSLLPDVLAPRPSAAAFAASPAAAPPPRFSAPDDKPRYLASTPAIALSRSPGQRSAPAHDKAPNPPNHTRAPTQTYRFI